LVGSLPTPVEAAKPGEDAAATLALVRGVFRSGLEHLKKIT
jgi:hypothetical protein